MNWHLLSNINGFVCLNCSFRCSKWIARAFCINSSFQFKDNWFFYNINVWHQTLNCISNNDLETNINEPLRQVVREWTIESFPEFFRFKLLQIGIYNQNNKTCVEELTKESTFDNRTFLLRNCIFTNPRYKSYNSHF